MRIDQESDVLTLNSNHYETLYFRAEIFYRVYDNKSSLYTFYVMANFLTNYDNSLMINGRPLEVKDILEYCDYQKSTCYNHINYLKKVNLLKVATIDGKKVMFLSPFYARRTLQISDRTYELFREVDI